MFAEKNRKFEYFTLISLFIVAASFMLSIYVLNAEGNQFSDQAWSFIHGRTDLMTDKYWVDVTTHAGKMYWVLSPVPALLFVPVNGLFGQVIPQIYLSLVANFALGLLIFMFAQKRFGLSTFTSGWLTLAYMFGSVYVTAALIPWPYFFAHTLSTLAVFASLYEYYGNKRWWIVGILLALAFMIRPTAGLAVLFFGLVVLFNGTTLREKIRPLAALSLPLVIGFLLLMGYNYVRFDNPFDNGYMNSNNASIEYRKEHGMFNLRNIPTNFYYYFLEGLQPVYAEPEAIRYHSYYLRPPYIIGDSAGSISFFIVSPIFLLLFWRGVWEKREFRYAIYSAGAILLLLLTYFYHGSPQIGPRYMNDLLPLLFLSLLYSIQKTGLKKSHKLVIIFSVALNIYLTITTFFLDYIVRAVQLAPYY